MNRLIMVLCLFTVLAQASKGWAGERELSSGVSYCVEGIDSLSEYTDELGFESTLAARLESPYFLDLHPAAMSCLEKEGWMTGLEVVSLSLTTASVAALVCGPATAGVSITVGVATGFAGLTTNFAKMILSNMPCEDTYQQRIIENKVKEVICEIAGKEGGQCDMDKIQIKYQQEGRGASRRI